MTRIHDKKTNRDLLKKWVRSMKLRNPSIESDLMKEIRISNSTFQKLLYSEGYLPNEHIRLLLVKYTKLNEDELFPIVSSEEEVA